MFLYLNVVKPLLYLVHVSSSFLCFYVYCVHMFKHQGHYVCGYSNVSCRLRFLQVIVPGPNQGQGCKISQFETSTIKNSQFESLTDSKFLIQWDPGPVFKMPEKSLPTVEIDR